MYNMMRLFPSFRCLSYHNLFHRQFSTEWDLVLTLNFPYSLISLKPTSSSLHLPPCITVTSVFQKRVPTQDVTNQPSFFLLYAGYSFCPSRSVILPHSPHDRSNSTPPSFSSTTFQNFPRISNLFSEVSQVSAPHNATLQMQHFTRFFPKFQTICQSKQSSSSSVLLLPQ